jgi:NAD(P)-dependent dehydrogenase (short-subunit alcohol dehydrogenase family)
MSTNAKVAFVTGVDCGLGLQTARELGRLGVLVILGSRNPEKGKAAAVTLRSERIAAEGLRCDITQPQDHRAVREFFKQRYGRLDILVSNATVLLESGDDAPAVPANNTSMLTPRILRETFEANFFGPVALTQALLPLIRKSPAGRIVNFSSILESLTLHSDPGSRIYRQKTFAYNASKTALNAFTVHLAHELRDTPIKVNSAHPGWVRTDMGAQNAELKIAEGGKTIARLATLPFNGAGAFSTCGGPVAISPMSDLYRRRLARLIALFQSTEANLRIA